MTDLYNCRIDESYHVSKLMLSQRERTRLESLGLFKGASVRVRLRTQNGAIIEAYGTRVAMSKRICRRVVLGKEKITER